MSDLITYIQGVPVRKDGVTFQQILRAYGESEKKVEELESELIATRMELEEYQAIGSKRLFHLLIGKYKNGGV